jgi:hypothetical protein
MASTPLPLLLIISVADQDRHHHPNVGLDKRCSDACCAHA